MLDLIGRGEWIQTTDLTVPNDRRGKNVQYLPFDVCSHQRISNVYIRSHSLPFVYRLDAEDSVHKIGHIATPAGVFEFLR